MLISLDYYRLPFMTVWKRLSAKTMMEVQQVATVVLSPLTSAEMLCLRAMRE